MTKIDHFTRYCWLKSFFQLQLFYPHDDIDVYIYNIFQVDDRNWL